MRASHWEGGRGESWFWDLRLDHCSKYSTIHRGRKRRVLQHCVWGARLRCGSKGAQELEPELSASWESVLAEGSSGLPSWYVVPAGSPLPASVLWYEVGEIAVPGETERRSGWPWLKCSRLFDNNHKLMDYSIRGFFWRWGGL